MVKIRIQVLQPGIKESLSLSLRIYTAKKTVYIIDLTLEKRSPRSLIIMNTSLFLSLVSGLAVFELG